LVVSISSEKPAALRQDLVGIAVGGYSWPCACLGVRESEVGAVQRKQMIRAVEVLGQQQDVSPLAAEDVDLLA
jgi:hypothetical protein